MFERQTIVRRITVGDFQGGNNYFGLPSVCLFTRDL